MKNPTLISEKYRWRALSMSAAIWLPVLIGCSSVDGTAENHRVTRNLVTGHTEQVQEKPKLDDPPDSPEPDYDWFY